MQTCNKLDANIHFSMNQPGAGWGESPYFGGQIQFMPFEKLALFLRS
jgi:hypothetical protein